MRNPLYVEYSKLHLLSKRADLVHMAAKIKALITWAGAVHVKGKILANSEFR